MRKLLILGVLGPFCLSGGSAYAVLALTALNTPVTQDFSNLTSSGTSLNTLNGTDVWKLAGGASPTFSSGSNTTALIVASASFTTGGNYNFGAVSGSDRAVGFLTSGGFSSPRSLLVEITNSIGSTITDLNVGFDYEKYRNNTTTSNLTFFYSSDGSTWTAATGGDQSNTADGASSYGTPISTSSKSVTLSGLSIADAGKFYLRWTFSNGAANSQAYGVDNLSITAVPEASAFLFGGAVCSVAGLWSLRNRRRRAVGLA
jgi:hypothetical protein